MLFFLFLKADFLQCTKVHRVPNRTKHTVWGQVLCFVIIAHESKDLRSHYTDDTEQRPHGLSNTNMCFCFPFNMSKGLRPHLRLAASLQTHEMYQTIHLSCTFCYTAEPLCGQNKHSMA